MTNAAYRDHVNTIMMAYTLAKPIVLYVDGCTNSTTPRDVGMDSN